MHEASHILDTATATLKERAKERDVESERAMAKTVAMFNASEPQQLTEVQGWKFMIFLKMARASQGQYRMDDYVDLSAYAALMGECQSKEAEE